jgi:hypothetical protein
MVGKASAAASWSISGESEETTVRLRSLAARAWSKV